MHATPLQLAIILVQANVYSQESATLHLGGTIWLLCFQINKGYNQVDVQLILQNCLLQWQNET